MPIIPFAYLLDNKLHACTIGCTEEEAEEWLKNEVMPNQCIPTDYLEQYLKLKGYKIELSTLFRKEVDRKFLYPTFVTPNETKSVLAEFNLDYSKFIDDYAIYLKNL